MGCACRQARRNGSLAMVSEPSPGRFGRLFGRGRGFPSERDWERSALLGPRLRARDPELIGDGGGLPFPPAALTGPAAQLDPSDGAVGALIAQLGRQKAPKGGARKSRPAAPSLDGWRLLARTDEEALFGGGRPPQMVTVAVRRDGRGGRWTCVGVTRAGPLRAARDGIRASGWRLDPTLEPDPEETVLRVLVTEQTWAGGKRADDRLLAPDLHAGAYELVLTMFVTPLQGFQIRSPNPETCARIVLPGPVGERRLIDGAVYGAASPVTFPAPEAGNDGP